MRLIDFLRSTARKAARLFRTDHVADPKATAEHGRDLELCRLYHNRIGSALESIDEATWQDLALDDVFRKIDRTASWLGSQALYHRMRGLGRDETQGKEQTRQYQIFQKNLDWATQARSILHRLEGRDTAWLAPFLLDGTPERPRHSWALYLCAIAPGACFIGGFVLPPLFLLGLLFILVNIYLNETQGRWVTGHIPALAKVHTLLGVARDLAVMPNPDALPQIASLHERRGLVFKIHQRLGPLAIDRTQLPELVAVLHGYLNLIFLLDVVAFLRAIPMVALYRNELLDFFSQVGTLDASMAVAEYLESLPGPTVTPVFTTDGQLVVRGLYHPLLHTPVGNELDLPGRSALITGSNMAGKTTFIRSVGINLVLGHTLHFCLAEEAKLPRVAVKSLIRRPEGFLEGRSYYFAELDRLLEFVEDTKMNQDQIILIDEILRGTNTVERIAAATAVLRYLGRTSMVLVTTHDLELADALADQFDLYHFSEQVVSGTYGFDYRLRKGPATARNAIKLMALHGFPDSIVQEAMSLANRRRMPPQA